jgi:hypothetical protein
MKTIIEMAEEVGALGYVRDHGEKPHQWIFTPKELKAFAELARADEREACAKVCDDVFSSSHAGRIVCDNLAHAIRARGQA